MKDKDCPLYTETIINKDLIGGNCHILEINYPLKERVCICQGCASIELFKFKCL